jgi:spore coat polysaccharide biosynthesis protein SpsF
VKIFAIIQARMSSTRLPGKVLKELCGIPVLVHVIERVKQSKRIGKIIIATTDNSCDDVIVSISKKENVEVFRGSEDDVLKRYYQAAKQYKADIIVRITSDDPLIDYQLIDSIIENLIVQKADYSCNNMPASYPLGLDCECFTFETLEKAFENAKEKREQEHVTPYIREHKDLFKIVNISSNVNYSHIRLTLDTMDDYDYIKQIYENLYYKNKYFLTNEIIDMVYSQKIKHYLENEITRF